MCVLKVYFCILRVYTLNMPKVYHSYKRGNKLLSKRVNSVNSYKL